jgi:hypothetical protein
MNGTLVTRALLRLLSLAPAVLIVAAGAVVAGQAGAIARVAFVEGQVEILRYGSEVPLPAEVGMSLRPGDQIKAKKGKCQLNFSTSGILRLSPGEIVLFPTREDARDGEGLRVFAGRAADRVRQRWSADEVFDVRNPNFILGAGGTDYDPAPPDVRQHRAKEDAERLKNQLNRRVPPPGETGDDAVVAQYQSLLPAALQADRKPWHTRFEFIANAVREGTGYRVSYKTYCLIEQGPDKGKDYPCFEFDSVLDIGALKTAVAGMKQRLGR